MNEHEEYGDGNARHASENAPPAPAPEQPDVVEAGANVGEPERSDSDDSDDSL